MLTPRKNVYYEWTDQNMTRTFHESQGHRVTSTAVSLQDSQHTTGFPGRPIYDMILAVVFKEGFLDHRDRTGDPSEMHRPQILGLGAGSWCFPSFLHGSAIPWVLRNTWARCWMPRLSHIGSPSGEVGAFVAFLKFSPLRINVDICVLAQCDD